MTAARDLPRAGYSRCFSTLACPEASLDQVAEITFRHGLDKLELRCLGGELLDEGNLARLIGDAPAARQRLAARGLGVAMLSTSLRLLEPEANALSVLAAFGRVADDLGAPFIRVFDGGEHDRAPTDAEWTAAAHLVDAWEHYRAQAGLRCRLAIETHWAFTSLAVTAEFAQRFPRLSLLWDTHHTWKAGVTVEEFWTAHHDRIVHLHTNDSVATPLKPEGYRYVFPGHGEFDFQTLRDLLTRDRFTGTVSFEWERRWVPELPPLEEALPHWLAQMP